MQLQEAKEHFIQTWGTLATNWGINRTMAQIHALLMVSPEAMSTEDIMERLNISRGNVNMNLRELLNWGLIQKEIKHGERKEFFVAEKDIWEVSKCIIRERKKREFDPVRKSLEHLSSIEGNPQDEEYASFVQMLKEIQNLTKSVDTMLEKVAGAEKNWFFKKLLKFFTA